jgi:hypothetical protein
MSKDYAREAATARRLIEKFGGDALVVRVGEETGPAYDPTIGAEQTFPAIIADIGYSITRRNDSVIEAGTKVGVMVMENGDIPLKTDSLRINGVDFVFTDLQPLQPNPDGAIVLYEYTAKSAVIEG